MTLFLARTKKKQDITAALALARDCKHPDAVWLTSIFEGKNVSTKEDARKVFLSFENDARALCYAWYLTSNRGNDFSLIRRAAEMGNAFALSTLSERVLNQNKETFCLAQLAATQHERDGYRMLGSYFIVGISCEKDLRLAKENYLIAAELGHGRAAERLRHFLDKSDPVRWLWLGRAALRGHPDILFSFSEQVDQFFSGSGNATVVFLIGRALKGNIDMEEKCIFRSSYNFDSRIGPANQAVSFYSSQIKSARLAVDTWALVSTRLHLIKDMRIYIGKMIWEGRFEANYKIEIAIAPRASSAQKRSHK